MALDLAILGRRAIENYNLFVWKVKKIALLNRNIFDLSIGSWLFFMVYSIHLMIQGLKREAKKG